MPRTIDLDTYAAGVLDGSRSALARAITLVESTRPDHREKAQSLLTRLLPHSGGSHRLGVTGVPGVGKSTFIEALGTRLVAEGHRVGVLAVDPSSHRSGGSILGDKTRMGSLATESNAFIRPSPTAGTLGGVARATRETIVLMEAAGFDVVLVETVGVGQSETAVAGMVDCFLLLTLARTGDQLQGIKKGVLELADLVAVNKADGEHQGEARETARELRGALRLLTPPNASWKPRVLTCSGLTGTGLEELWRQVTEHRAALEEAGELAEKRRNQRLEWTWELVRDQLVDELVRDPEVGRVRAEVERRVLDGELTAGIAAERMLRAFRSR
ncbi:methylmalonyl Co-A mutase-associated GTPase MeaB [Actinopolyspora mortivallis]|uniref:Methylmalonyl Co-A mutase-associated GTPase MeaB n=1 Tax=Actinopolyspora mortivallis TaxID=33906 RepID=A0A2T0GYY8_ACTMO|nr:methylmalonyl Co-A mutase-associated GTPase MeaB [Actinopolyspora mortivallis]PRW64332.1 methylmalonyl Co-A mutase-associated GTPase MeaB [Actinopolyspora mortivallis]